MKEEKMEYIGRDDTDQRDWPQEFYSLTLYMYILSTLIYLYKFICIYVRIYVCVCVCGPRKRDCTRVSAWRLWVIGCFAYSGNGQPAIISGNFVIDFYYTPLRSED